MRVVPFSSTEDVLRFDPLMRVAMSIGDQAGVPKDLMQDWYGQVCLGEIEVSELFLKLQERVSDPKLLSLLLTTQEKLSSVHVEESGRVEPHVHS